MISVKSDKFSFLIKIFHVYLTIQSGLAGSLANLKLGEAVAEQSAYENNLRRANWEAGRIDYLGNFFTLKYFPLIWVCFLVSILSKVKN